MDDAQKQIVESISADSNILVTVSANPTVDELSAALGLTLLLDKMDKRATAVASGTIPSAIHFLEPDKTFENTADSLRDFIIALNKEKADHLRYKVDGDVVKIFITPYKTTLSQSDLEFSQGDYNVELVIGLGVKDQEHLDKALEAHGKILHDAKVVTVSSGSEPSKLGSIDWHSNDTSSISEMVTSLADALKESGATLDQQIATALLTGIVSATDRFSNDHTTSKSMTMAAQLMAAGANQQLIASKLAEGNELHQPHQVDDSTQPSLSNDSATSGSDGTELTIDRSNSLQSTDMPASNGTPANEQKKVIEPIHQEVSAPGPQAEPEQSKTSTEDSDQLELEKQLAGLTAPSTGTMEDIEKQLQEVADQAAAGENTADLTASKDMTMPGFEPTIAPVTDSSPVIPEPTASESTDESNPPEIINQHGTLSEPPVDSMPPLNSVQVTDDTTQKTIDPFNNDLNAQPTPLDSSPVAMPPLDGEMGTAEGAALLAGEPSDQPSFQPVIPPAPVDDQSLSQPSDMSVPELPPLPPLPPDDSLPPLPPPPPPIDFSQPIVDQAPSGALTGDVFGDDTTASSAPTVEQTPTPSVPGQFKIPGQ